MDGPGTLPEVSRLFTGFVVGGFAFVVIGVIAVVISLFEGVRF